MVMVVRAADGFGGNTCSAHPQCCEGQKGIADCSTCVQQGCKFYESKSSEFQIECWKDVLCARTCQCVVELHPKNFLSLFMRNKPATI